MAALLAVVNAAAKGTATRVATLKRASPVFSEGLAIFGDDMICMAGFLVTSVGAENGLFHLSTIAAGINTNLASTTQALMARAWAVVLAAGHHVIADFTAAPAILVVGINTSSCVLMLAAKAHLSWTHVSTRWTGTSMTGELAGVGTLSKSFLAACIAT